MIDDNIPPATVKGILELHETGSAVIAIAKRKRVCIADIVQILRRDCKGHVHGRGVSRP